MYLHDAVQNYLIWLLTLPYQVLFFQILSFEGGKVFCANITVFNDATQGNNSFDNNCVDTKFALDTGCMKIIFLNKFVQDLLVGNLLIYVVP